jgi:hypothetical protein
MDYLPISLATKKMATRYEKRQLKQGLTPQVQNEETDMFKRDGEDFALFFILLWC